MAFTYWDTYRRGIGGVQFLFWLAMVLLLPFIGFFIFLFFRVLAQIFTSGSRGTDPKTRRETALKRPPAMRKALPTFFSRDLIKETVANPGQIFQPIVERRAKYVFTITSGVNTGQEFVIENPPVKIGRGSGIPIRLDEDMGVSRQHAEVYELNGNLRIRDLDSTHGTKVNGIRIEDKSLKPGDRLEIGLTVLVVREMQER